MTKYTAFRCPLDILAKAKIKAKSQRRSLSNYIITLIEENVGDIDLPAKALKAAVKPKTGKAKPGRPKKYV
jgi:hypothetical protein